MRRLAVAFIIILFSSVIQGAEPLGYEHFKLGMSEQEMKDIYNKHYKNDWLLKPYAHDNTGIEYNVGYMIGKKYQSKTILILLTKGLNGSVASIGVAEPFHTDSQDEPLAKFNYIKNVLIRKYGKPIKNYDRSGSIDTAGWKYGDKYAIVLTVDYDKENDVYRVGIIYVH